MVGLGSLARGVKAPTPTIEPEAMKQLFAELYAYVFALQDLANSWQAWAGSSDSTRHIRFFTCQ